MLGAVECQRGSEVKKVQIIVLPILNQFITHAAMNPQHSHLSTHPTLNNRRVDELCRLASAGTQSLRMLQ
jgi:hypothetical protein